MEIIARRDAASRGMKRYYTGKACSKGHVAERFVTTGGCVKCNADRSKLFAKELRDAEISRRKGWFTYRAHPDDIPTILAFCQGLDMQRGRMPHIPSPNVVATPATIAQSNEYTEEMRREVLRRREEIITRSMPAPSYNDDNLSPEEMAR